MTMKIISTLSPYRITRHSTSWIGLLPKLAVLAACAVCGCETTEQAESTPQYQTFVYTSTNDRGEIVETEVRRNVEDLRKLRAEADRNQRKWKLQAEAERNEREARIRHTNNQRAAANNSLAQSVTDNLNDSMRRAGMSGSQINQMAYQSNYDAARRRGMTPAEADAEARQFVEMWKMMSR